MKPKLPAPSKTAPSKPPAQASKSDASDSRKSKSLNDAKTIANNSNTRESRVVSATPIPKPIPTPTPTPTPTPIPTPTPATVPAPKATPIKINTSSEQKNIDSDFSRPRSPAMPPMQLPNKLASIESSKPEQSSVVKTPTRDITNISSLVPQFNAEHITKILFESLSAVELSVVERHDTIEGINQKYSIISNLSDIRKKYDIAKQLTVMDKFKPLTRIFTINIEDKIPQEDYIALEDLTATYQYLDENNQIVTREKGYYYIDTNGDLVIELIGLERNQEVEVQIDTNGTIYKVES